MKPTLPFLFLVLALLSACDTAKEKNLQAVIILSDECDYGMYQDSVDACFRFYDKNGKDKFGFMVCARVKKESPIRVNFKTMLDDGDQWALVNQAAFCGICIDTLSLSECRPNGIRERRMPVDSILYTAVICTCR